MANKWHYFGLKESSNRCCGWILSSMVEERSIGGDEKTIWAIKMATNVLRTKCEVIFVQDAGRNWGFQNAIQTARGYKKKGQAIRIGTRQVR